MTEQPFQRADVESLVAKLESMDFTPGELSVLQAAFQSLSEGDEVQGFWFGLGGLILSTSTQGTAPSPISNVMKTKHETVKNTLNNVR